MASQTRAGSRAPIESVALPAGFTVLCGAMLTCFQAWGQQAPATKQDEIAVLDRVVVTSDKRVEKQRDIAGTVSVLDGSDLERRGARNQEDAFKLTPGVQFNKGDVSSNTITIRGIGTSTTNEGSGNQQGPTGQYLEDVPLASPQGKGTVWDPLTWDLDRVEVLRGPQGVLFGSGSLGGAVRYLFNKPRFDSFEASLKEEYAKVSDGDHSFSTYGMLNVPLANGVAAARVVLFDRRDPGYIDNLGNGTKDANDLHQRGGRLLVSVKPTSSLLATLVASSQRTKQGDTFSVSPDPERLEHTSPTNSSRSSTNDLYSLTLDWNLGKATLTSVTGYWHTKSTASIDDTELFGSVGLPLPQVTRPSSGNEHATSQELRIASNPGTGPISYVAGVFYQKSRSEGAAQQIDPSGAFGLTNLVDLTTAGGGTETAVFADAEWTINSSWSFGAGGRYYRTTTQSQQRGTIFGAPADIPDPATGAQTLDSKDNGFTPKLVLKYRFGGGMWYGLVSRGYRYGGVNGTPPFKPYKSDSLWNYETGLRLTPTADLQLDLTAFMLDWKDAQFTYFVLNGPLPESGIDNVGKARSTGLEAALRWRASAAFSVAASLAAMNAKTRTDVAIPAGGPNFVTAPSGSRLPGTPRFQSALQGTWHFTAPFDSSGRLDATYTHVGERVMFLGNNKPAGSYNTLDFNLNLARDAWTVAAGLLNVTNEKGIQSITGAPAGVGSFAQYFLQRPRTFTVSLRYDY